MSMLVGRALNFPLFTASQSKIDNASRFGELHPNILTFSKEVIKLKPNHFSKEEKNEIFWEIIFTLMIDLIGITYTFLKL